MRLSTFLILFTLLLSACANTNDEASTSKASKNDEPQKLNVRNSTIASVDKETGQQISEHLVKLASSVPSVKNATAVVLGKYAIVGIDVDENIDRSQVGSIKYTVAEGLKHDPHGAKAIVVADPDLTARLKEIQEDIKSGKPIAGIVNELADISGRLMPEIPADIVDPNPNKATEKAKRKLSDEETKQLEDVQNKESKGHKDE